MPNSILETAERPALLEIQDLRGLSEATPESELARQQRQRLDRETQWEGYAAERDHQFAGLLGIVTETARCSREAREEPPR